MRLTRMSWPPLKRRFLRDRGGREHIVQIAQKAKTLGHKMKRRDVSGTTKGDMTKEEAYEQLSDSASLFKAVLEYVNYPGRK